METKQGASQATVHSKSGGDSVGHPREAASPVDRARAAAASAIGVERGAATWFRGVLLRRRCDSCGSRISILSEGDDKVFMRCPECLREYVFFHRPE